MDYVFFEAHVLAYVKSALGCLAYYPIHPVEMKTPIKAELMDLEVTSVRSEKFWIWIIQLSTASLLNKPDFELCENDLPYVSGHSVSEHLQYCIHKYCPEKTVEEARKYYFEPHPWLYAEVARVGLDIRQNENAHMVGIEDSSAGVCAIRLANIPVIGVSEGNIEQSGTVGLCHHYCCNFNQILSIIDGKIVEIISEPTSSKPNRSINMF